MAREFPLKMEWEPSNIVVTRSTWYTTMTGYSFVGAMQVYKSSKFGDVPVMFENERVYTFLYDDATRPITLSKFKDDIKKAIKAHDANYPEFHKDGDNYYELYNGCEWQDGVLKYLDLSDCKEDILDRFDDLMVMWEYDEIPVGIVVS